MSQDLHGFLREHHTRVVDEWAGRVSASLLAEPAGRAELIDHVPTFLDELIADLLPEVTPPQRSASAIEHGGQRLRIGFNVGQVAREYGLLHECILALAHAAGVTVAPHEHLIVASRISNGTATAVSQYVVERDAQLQRQASEHIAFIAHELRGPLASARMALELLSRDPTRGQRFLAMLERAVSRCTSLVDATLTHAWLKLGIEPQRTSLDVAAILEELRAELSPEAERKGVRVDLVAGDNLHVDADPRLLRSAVSNLLGNAIKFTRAGTVVTVRAWLADERTRIEVEDRCGGLPPGKAEELFHATVQRGEDRSGSGLGLAIAKQAVTAHGGAIVARDLPGKGCIFAIELPVRPL